jgi:hypothetical protein
MGKNPHLSKKDITYKSNIVEVDYASIEGASTAAKSKGKLCALRSCITSIPKLARLMMSAQVLTTRP